MRSLKAEVEKERVATAEVRQASRHAMHKLSDAVIELRSVTEELERALKELEQDAEEGEDDGPDAAAPA